MVELTNEHDPQWALMPVNGMATGWRPFGTPMILIVPDRRDPLGYALPNSGVWGVRIYVEDVPQKAWVTGHQHTNPDTGQQLQFPDRELYAVTLGALELDDRTLVKNELEFYRPLPDGSYQPLDQTEARGGDVIRFTTATGVTDYLPYLPSADYYDLSDVLLEVEQLPVGRYNLVYECSYYFRQRTQHGTGELLCIDLSQQGLARRVFPFNHPGELMDEFHRLTPGRYLTTATKAQDTTLALYRPFTDLLQDIYDEQQLLQRLNWVRNCPSEAIPYLSVLLGWDLPYFPQSLDSLRRVVLRNTSRLQGLKGSRRGLVELFRLMGLDILISNLWWSADGKTLIRPGAQLPEQYREQQIEVESVHQLEPVLIDYSQSGFGQLTIPLLHRPDQQGGLDQFVSSVPGGDVVLDCYLVERGSQAEQRLQQLSAQMMVDPDGFYAAHPGLYLDQRGRQHSYLTQQLEGLELGGYSQLRLRGEAGAAELVAAQSGWGRPPLAALGVQLDRVSNQLRISFDGYLHFDGGDSLPPKRRQATLYGFATYSRQLLLVPPAIEQLQSNRFDVQLLQAEIIPPLAGQKTYISTGLLDFAFEFLHKIKAFHSLLNVVRLAIELTETYEVTTTCIGGDIQQRHDVDMGKLQVPPAIIPRVAGTDDCAELDPERLGYKRADSILRLRKLANLPEEHAGWRALDPRAAAETYQVTGTRLAPMLPAPGREQCLFGPQGQDRILVQPRVEQATVVPHPAPNASQQGAGQQPDLCPVELQQQGQFLAYGATASAHADASAFGSFVREAPAPQLPACELDGVTDYCYKGRVGDELLYRVTMLGQEAYRPRSCAIGLGSGVYWTYPARVQLVLAGTARPAPHSRSVRPVYSGGRAHPGELGYLQPPLTRYLSAPYRRRLQPDQDSWLGRGYRAIGLPQDQSLHFSDRRQGVSLQQSTQPTLQRPGLDVQLPNLHFPGCRFPTLNRLEADHLQPLWRAKPWDDPYSSPCGVAGSCAADPGWLGARLVPGPHGDRLLQYDDAACLVRGNGLPADIPTLEDHTLGGSAQFAAAQVVHELYSAQASGHPAITLDQTQLPATGVAPEGYLELDGRAPLFSSAQQCVGTGAPQLDFVDGYPASTGWFSPQPVDWDRHGAAFQPLPAQALFLLGDGIEVGQGQRLDCGCLVAGCDDQPGESLCSTELYYNQWNQLEWEADQAWVFPTMVLDETMGPGRPLDGSLGTLFELLGPCPDQAEPHRLARLPGTVGASCGPQPLYGP